MRCFRIRQLCGHALCHHAQAEQSSAEVQTHLLSGIALIVLCAGTAQPCARYSQCTSSTTAASAGREPRPARSVPQRRVAVTTHHRDWSRRPQWQPQTRPNGSDIGDKRQPQKRPSGTGAGARWQSQARLNGAAPGSKWQPQQRPAGAAPGGRWQSAEAPQWECLRQYVAVTAPQWGCPRR